jgi:hypothetical protein
MYTKIMEKGKRRNTRDILKLRDKQKSKPNL